MQFYFIDRISFNSITFYSSFYAIPDIEISSSHINLFDPPTYILSTRLWEYSNTRVTSVNDLAKHLACGEWLSADANDARNSWRGGKKNTTIYWLRESPAEVIEHRETAFARDEMKEKGESFVFVLCENKRKLKKCSSSFHTVCMRFLMIINAVTEINWDIAINKNLEQRTHWN